MEEIIKNIAQKIKEKLTILPDIAIILGSGLDGLAQKLQNQTIIRYDELPNMPRTNVQGHKNQFIFGSLYGKNIIAMQGRFHFYSGFSAKQVAMPIYIFKELGVKTLIVTNAAGGVNPTFKPGDLMLITDHINFTGQNPLIGGAPIDYGVEFVDMQDAYNSEYCELVRKIAKQNCIALKEGAYMQFTGPSYETKAEVKFARAIGADAVGMSTALEVISAVQCNLKVLGISVITNMGSGMTTEKMTHEEVLENSKIASKNLETLIENFVEQI